MSYENNHDFDTLNGRHIVKVDGLEPGSERVTFECADGSQWTMAHSQDCCEFVRVEDVIGDVDDLRDADVIEARCETSQDEDPADRTRDKDERYRDSFTWTFYIIQTNKGAVTIRWLGESNGYYGERVDFACARAPTAGENA